MPVEPLGDAPQQIELVYAALEEKVAAVERELQALAADPARVQALAGWHWIDAAWAALPPGEDAQALELVA